MDDFGQWLAAEEACIFMGVSRATFYRAGYPVDHFENGRAYYRRSHLQSFKNNKVKAKHPGVVSKGGAAPVATVENVAVSPVEPLLVTIADVCRVLNISRSTLFRLDKVGAVPGRIILGGQVRYRRDKIVEWILNGCE